MSSSLVTTQFKSFWRRAVGSPNMKVCLNPTIIRKHATTAVPENYRDIKKDVADHINHSETIADQDYDLVDKQKKAARISGRIHSIQRDGTAEEQKKRETNAINWVYKMEINTGYVNTENSKED